MSTAVLQNLIERMHDRKIGLDDLNRLRLWLESQPEVSEGPWYKDFGSFKLCGEAQVSQDISACGSSGTRGKTVIAPVLVPQAGHVFLTDQPQRRQTEIIGFLSQQSAAIKSTARGCLAQ